jgi:hypothetical protein
MPLPLLLSLVAAAAAEDASTTEKKPDAPEFHVEATSQIMPSTVALDLRARADGKHDGYVSAVMRVDPTGMWIGRAGVGVDVFGGGDGFDLKLGLFLGGTGDIRAHAMYGRPTAGAEALLGVKIGRVYGWYRHTDGFAGPLEDRLTEDELRLGFRLTDTVRVHGQYLIYNPGDAVLRGGAGAGVEVVF